MLTNGNGWVTGFLVGGLLPLTMPASAVAQQRAFPRGQRMGMPLPALRVTFVVPGSPEGQAGLMPGDLIYYVNDAPAHPKEARIIQTSRVVVLVVSRGRFAPRQRVVLFPVNGRIGINFQYIEDLLANGRPRL